MKIHALLIGINNYNKIGRLDGCVNDIKKIEKYISKNIPYNEITMLLDDQATRPSIIDAVFRIKQNISENDTFLFYFAGHGTLERADPIWNETNEVLECIVCYDENPATPSGFLLADKELRYLIWELSKTGSHIVTIFDCCHSGGITRNLGPISSAFHNQDIHARRHYHTYPQRKWSEFIFGPNINRDAISGKHVNEFLPQGEHVQIAACQSDEVAFETKGEGVFTKTFLKVLEDSGGKISYHNLRNRIRQFVRFVYDQQPRIYTIGSSDEETQRLLFTRFLNNSEIDDQHFISEAVYNKTKGWLLNLGAIHGINADSEVDLIDPVSPPQFYRARIKEVFIDYTLLEVNGTVSIPYEYTVLKARIKDFEMDELKLDIIKHDGNPEQLKKIADALFSIAGGNYRLAAGDTLADYAVHATSDLIYITKPNDPFRPIVKPIEFKKENLSACINRLTEHLKHIIRWNYIQQLQTKTIHKFTKQPIKISVVQMLNDGTKKNIDVPNDQDGISHAGLSPFVKSQLSITLTNQTDQRLFIAVAYLSFDFKVYIHLLEDKVALVNPGRSVSMGKQSKSWNETGNLIPLKLPDVIQEYNWPGYTETIKIIISNEEFNHEALSLDPLPAPYTLKDKQVKERHRNFDFEDDESNDKTMNLEGWMTQTVRLAYPNIFFDKVEPDIINQMLGWDKMAFFAKELYGDNS